MSKISGVEIKNVGKEQKIIEDEFLEDGEMFEDEEKFWEEMNINKEKRKMDKEEKKKVEEEKREVKEEKNEEKIDEEQKINEKQKPEVKNQCTNLYNKYKRKREDEDVGDYKIYKRRKAPEYFQYGCELLTNDEKNSIRPTKNIRPSSLDTISYWKELYMSRTDSRKDHRQKLRDSSVLQVKDGWHWQINISSHIIQ
jgi:hypothetical protein